MKRVVKLAAPAAMLAAAAVWGGTAAAGDFGFNISIGVPGAVGFDVGTGGFCDSWGCPDDYWDFPVWYGPVYYDGAWFRGPVYYREIDGQRVFWVHGGWHADQWRGPRPSWWSASYHYGPALGFGYYHDHGFRIPERQWSYWHDHGGEAWEREHHVDWYRGRDVRTRTDIREDNHGDRMDTREDNHGERMDTRQDNHGDRMDSRQDNHQDRLENKGPDVTGDHGGQDDKNAPRMDRGPMDQSGTKADDNQPH